MKTRIFWMIALCTTLVGGTTAAETAQRPAPAEDEGEEEGEEQEGGEGEEAPSLGRRPADRAGFVQAMSEEISEIGQRPVCEEAAGRCRYHYQSGEQSYEIQLWYGESTETIYIFVNHMAEAPATSSATPGLLRYLAAASWELRIARFEWSSETGEVRLSTVQNVDTNLDRRALRNLLRFVQDAVDRYRADIARLLDDETEEDDAPEPPAPGPERAEQVNDRHGYMDAIEQELERMGLNPACDAEQGTCTYDFDATEEAMNVFGVTVRYDSRTNVVLVSVDRYLTLPPENPRTEAALQRLLELNWEQLVPMFQWNSRTNNVRLVGALNTDSNFDRRAFRGVVGGVHAAAARNYRAFRTMLNP